MGALSKLYANFPDDTAKHAVAWEFGFKHHKFWKSWLEFLVVFRNCHAHHSRLSNRLFPVKPMMPKHMPDTFVTDFKQLLMKHSSVSPHLLGFLIFGNKNRSGDKTVFYSFSKKMGLTFLRSFSINGLVSASSIEEIVQIDDFCELRSNKNVKSSSFRIRH